MINTFLLMRSSGRIEKVRRFGVLNEDLRSQKGLSSFLQRSDLRLFGGLGGDPWNLVLAPSKLALVLGIPTRLWLT